MCRKAFAGDGAAGHRLVHRRYFSHYTPILDFTHAVCHVFFELWNQGAEPLLQLAADNLSKTTDLDRLWTRRASRPQPM